MSFTEKEQIDLEDLIRQLLDEKNLDITFRYHEPSGNLYIKLTKRRE